MTVNVAVTTPGGTSAISRPADAYTYVPPPTVSDVTGLDGMQASGPLSGNTQFEISGTNLAGATAVVFTQGTTALGAARAFSTPSIQPRGTSLFSAPAPVRQTRERSVFRC